jgi:hypothetical protein
MLLIEQRVLIDNLLGLPITQLMKDTGPALVSSAVCIVAAAIIASLCSALPGVLIVLVASVAGLVAYGLTLRYIFPATWRGSLGLARSLATRAS